MRGAWMFHGKGRWIDTMDAELQKSLRERELVEVLGLWAKYGVIVCGVGCLGVYSMGTGQPAEGLGANDLLPLLLVSLVFMTSCALIGALSISAGCTLWIGLMRTQEWLASKRCRPSSRTGGWRMDRLNLSASAEQALKAAGLAGLLAFVGYALVRGQPLLITLSLLVVLAQGSAALLLIAELRSLGPSLPTVAVSGDVTRALHAQQRERHRPIRVLWIALFASPLLFPDRGLLVENAFRRVGLRKETATLQVKLPWATRLTNAGLKANPSSFGPDHVEFRGVVVALHGVGTKVVIEAPASARVRSLSIPKDFVHVE